MWALWTTSWISPWSPLSLHLDLDLFFPFMFPLNSFFPLYKGVRWVHITPPHACPPWGSTPIILILHCLFFSSLGNLQFTFYIALHAPKLELRKEINYIEDDNFLNYIEDDNFLNYIEDDNFLNYIEDDNFLNHEITWPNNLKICWQESSKSWFWMQYL